MSILGNVHRDLSRNINDDVCKNVEISNSFAKILRPYQIEGIRFLHKQFLSGDGAILNDDKGLGKTLQTILCLSGIQPNHSFLKTLVICEEDHFNHWLFHIGNYSQSTTSIFNEGSPESYKNVNYTITSITKKSMLPQYDWDAIVVDDLDPYETISYLNSVKCKYKIWLYNENLLANAKKLFKILNWISSGVSIKYESYFCIENSSILGAWTQRQHLAIFCNRWLLRRTRSCVGQQSLFESDKVNQKIISMWIKNQLSNAQDKSAGSTIVYYEGTTKESLHLPKKHNTYLSEKSMENKNNESEESVNLRSLENSDNLNDNSPSLLELIFKPLTSPGKNVIKRDCGINKSATEIKNVNESETRKVQSRNDSADEEINQDISPSSVTCSNPLKDLFDTHANEFVKSDHTSRKSPPKSHFLDILFRDDSVKKPRKSK